MLFWGIGSTCYLDANLEDRFSTDEDNFYDIMIVYS